MTVFRMANTSVLCAHLKGISMLCASDLKQHVPSWPYGCTKAVPFRWGVVITEGTVECGQQSAELWFSIWSRRLVLCAWCLIFIRV